jgi:hypothetical protein
MSSARLVQLLGLILVTWVMVRSFFVSDMTFQFGGLAVGALVFAVGRLMERRAAP